MAYIRKRGNSYYVEIEQRGIRKRATFYSKAEAVQWAANTETAIFSGKRKGGVPDLTFGELLARYAREVSVTKRGEKWECIRIAKMQQDPIAQVRLEHLDETHIADWRDRRLTCVSAGSVLREWTLLSSACSIAVKEWKWLRHHPMSNVRRPKAPPARVRRISQDEEDALLYVLGYDPGILLTTQTARVGAAFLFAIETAMRAGEIVGLTWDRVDSKNQVAHLDRTKNGTSRDVPLSNKAVRILKQLTRKKEPGVFGLSSQNLDTLFRKAKHKADIQNLHFHDTRHEAISRLAKKLEVLELARMVGHRNLNQLLVYYHTTAGELAKKLG